MIDHLVWIDCEMTGLDLEKDALIEVAAIVTDSDLSFLDDGIDLVIATPPEALAGMTDVVRDMHARSGLTVAAAAATLQLWDAEQQLLAYVRRHAAEPRRSPLCGNSIATDRAFLARDMPELDAWLHYRMLDVSTVKELARRWYPKVYYSAPQKRGGHRALADIVESVEELRYYRSTIFVRQPGPDVGDLVTAATDAAAAPPPASLAKD